jgi:hypothetical protein
VYSAASGTDSHELKGIIRFDLVMDDGGWIDGVDRGLSRPLKKNKKMFTIFLTEKNIFFVEKTWLIFSETLMH